MIAIKIKDVSKKFKGNGEFFALKNVNLEVEQGEFFCLLGPNGAGKTTLIQIILTILIPEEGEVKILGKNPFVEKEILQKINFVPMEKPYSHLRVKDFLYCYARLYDVKLERADFLIKEFGLEELKKSECWMLSTGEISRVALAKALLNNPKVLILDEPTFGLDPKSKIEIQNYLKILNRKGKTIIFATHDMTEVERLATRVGFIKEGRILDVEKKDKIVRKFGSVEKYWLRFGK
ncbi:MAG: ABC transporter ATP-binding protein [Candidatus Aenigmatarchaeota archaeon]